MYIKCHEKYLNIKCGVYYMFGICGVPNVFIIFSTGGSRPPLKLRTFLGVNAHFASLHRLCHRKL